jgi:phospholipase/carboxylesterase
MDGRAALGVALIACAVGCGSAPTPSTTTPSPAPLASLEVLTGGATASEPLPLVIALHGRGDTADGFTRAFRGMPTRARVLLLRAPIPEGDTAAWFTFAPVDTWSRVASDLLALADRVVATIDALPPEQRSAPPIVTGFSQGAMICYALALRHPTRFAAFHPVSGALSEEMLRTDPGDPAHTPPIVAFHGTRDEIIPLDAEQGAIDRLRARGFRAELHPHDATHWLDGEMRADLWRTIAHELGR